MHNLAVFYYVKEARTSDSLTSNGGIKEPFCSQFGLRFSQPPVLSQAFQQIRYHLISDPIAGVTARHPFPSVGTSDLITPIYPASRLWYFVRADCNYLSGTADS